MLKAMLTVAAFILGVVPFAFAQVASNYCDSTSKICYVGYTDPTLDITVGMIMPTSLTSNEYAVEIVAPVSYGYTGVSMGGQMANSLLFVTWPNAGEVVFSTRWTSGYIQPTAYTGPTITMLPDSTVNSTHIKASFRCQNCTVWNGGSLGSGDLNGTAVLAYVAQTTTPVDTPSNPNSNFVEHDQFSFFGVDLSTAHSSDYQSYIGAGSTTTSSSSSKTSSSSSTSHTTSSSTTSSAPVATQTKYGQCGGNGFTGPTTCASGTTCVAVSPPYYYQCQ